MSLPLTLREKEMKELNRAEVIFSLMITIFIFVYVTQKNNNLYIKYFPSFY